MDKDHPKAGQLTRGKRSMDDRTLFLHVGFQKTGTTFLQKHVFPHMASTHYLHKATTSASKAIIDAFASSPGIWRTQGDAIVRLLVNQIGGAPNGRWSALISSEAMSAPKIFARERLRSRRDPFLLGAHLKECRKSAEENGVTVKVILAVRRQDQYLASRFTSIGTRVGTLSQRNFERQMKEILDPSRRYFTDGIWLDYKLCRDLMVEALGERNCLLLPQELLANDDASFLRRLGDFIGERSLAENTSGATRENVKAVDHNVWALRETWPRSILRRCLKAVGLKVKPKRLRITDELKAQVLEVYRESNRHLGRDIQMDLGQYGYY